MSTKPVIGCCGLRNRKHAPTWLTNPNGIQIDGTPLVSIEKKKSSNPNVCMETGGEKLVIVSQYLMRFVSDAYLFSFSAETRQASS
jgi:hypothetical protein